MTQYKTRKSALNALSRHIRAPIPYTDTSPCEAEIWLVRSLLGYKKVREMDKNLPRPRRNTRPLHDRDYRTLKGIARSLGLYPIPVEVENYIKVLDRLEDKITIPDLGDNEWKRNGEQMALAFKEIYGKKMDAMVLGNAP